MHTRLLSVALAALLPLATHAAEPSRAVLLVQTYDNQPSDDPLEYIPVWLGKGVAKESTLPKALLGQPLQVFNAGVSTGNVRLAALTVDDNSMCGGTAKLRIKGNPTLSDSPLLSTVDVNPGKRFAGRAATTSEQAELFAQVNNTAQLRKRVKPAALAQALAAFNADRAQDLAALQIVTDTQQPQRRVAILTSNHPIETGNPDNPTGVLVVLAIFEHDGMPLAVPQGSRCQWLRRLRRPAAAHASAAIRRYRRQRHARFRAGRKRLRKLRVLSAARGRRQLAFGSIAGRLLIALDGSRTAWCGMGMAESSALRGPPLSGGHTVVTRAARQTSSIGMQMADAGL
ncbi:conserved hypothetical protein [Xanthomonas citri pv. aurantifolii str. ICPB 10535]|nr:conserved hypothetical protein [Xanthomonas citri pv. aurantifolii str. ICPB 10535]